MKSDLIEMEGATTVTSSFQSSASYQWPPAVVRTIDATTDLRSLDTTTVPLLVLYGDKATWVLEAAKKLEAVGRLHGGWDSYGGLPLRPESRALAVNVLRWLEDQNVPVPSVVLDSGGNIHLEWRAKGKELEVDLGSSNAIDFVKVRPDGRIEEGEARFNVVTQLKDLTWWLTHE